MSWEENFEIEHKFSHESYNNIGAYGDDTTYYNCVCGAEMPYTEFPEHLEHWKKLKETNHKRQKGEIMKKVVLTTTFELLKNHSACEEGYRKLGKYLGGITTYGKRTPINLLTILESNGVDDMLWCLRATKENCDKVSRLMAADFAEEVLPIFEKAYPDDKRPRKAIQASRDFANGLISSGERDAAGDAAGAAAWAAAWDAAGAAAWDAAGAAARAAAGPAAGAAAWDAAWDAAWATARAAAGAAAWAAARAAAGAAAWAAAWDAAWAAARAAAGAAAWDAARAAAGAAARAAAGPAAGDAAWDAAGGKQAQICKRYLK